MEDFFFKCTGKKALLLGMGGSGDVVSATILRRVLSLFDVKVTVGSVIWERFSIDPIPGPIHLYELDPVKSVDLSVGWINGETVAVRGEQIIKPQLAKVSDYLNEETLGIDLWAGYGQIVNELTSLVDKLDVEVVMGVDVGGDVLANGYEENLWSPLSDQIMLTILAELEKRGYKTVLAVHGLNVDGELNVDHLLKQLSLIASMGGYFGARGLNYEDVKLLKKLVKITYTESGILPLEAFKGAFGTYKIRMGTRMASLTPISTITFFLDPLKVFENSPMAKAITTTKNLDEANKILNEMGIYTELDLEKDEYEIFLKGEKLTKDIILKIRQEGRKLLRKHY